MKKLNELINEKPSEEQVEQLKRNKVKHADEMCKLEVNIILTFIRNEINFT